MPLPTTRREAIYDSVKEALSYTTDSEDDELSCPDGFLAVLAEATSVVNAAMADISEAWNARHCDHVLSLPVELVAQCFGLLSFRDRIAISHVSRAWRRVALSTTFLWTNASISLRAHRAGAAMLHALLARSDPLPFTFEWHSTEFDRVRTIPQNLLGMLAANMHRMRSVEIGSADVGDLQLLFDQPAPNLESFEATWTPADTPLPASWGVERAPMLSTLRLAEFSMPSVFEPLPAVRTFIGTLSSPHVPVSTIFPFLTTLSLELIKPAHLEHLTNLPSSITSLSLTTLNNSSAIDFGPFLRRHALGHIRRLTLMEASEFAYALPLFLPVAEDDWALEIGDAGNVNLLQDARGVTYSIICHHAVSLIDQSSFTSHLQQLSSLSLPLALLQELYDMDTWSRVLPSLRHFKLAFLSSDHMFDYEYEDVLAYGKTPISAPLLAAMEFTISPDSLNVVEWLTECFPALLPSLFSYDRPRMASIGIDLGDEFFRCRENVSALTALTECLYVKRRWYGRDTTEYVQCAPPRTRRSSFADDAY
ncbi:hypothetical protein AURDEDRAFT_185839 [Auricularia subglabra TFB-10046 SS5]|nr:hypothetical protein AURDEDRAFT_185839 [Auricularia subglabra TFB-10046 SS5]